MIPAPAAVHRRELAETMLCRKIQPRTLPSARIFHHAHLIGSQKVLSRKGGRRDLAIVGEGLQAIDVRSLNSSRVLRDSSCSWMQPCRRTGVITVSFLLPDRT